MRNAMEEDDESCLGHVKLKAYGRYIHEDA